MRVALAGIERVDDLHASRRVPPARVALTLVPRAVADAQSRCARSKTHAHKLTVNGETRVDVEPRTTLLDCLRDELGLTGAHTGCEHGVCGACTVLFNGEAVRSCLIFAPQAEGRDHHHRRRDARSRRTVAHPGRVLRDARDAMRLLHAGDDPCRARAARRNPDPTREEIVEAISGNICRCTGYAQIVEAIALAAERMRGANAPVENEAMSAGRFKFVSTDRRVREDRRFVAGKGSSSPTSSSRI